MSKAIITRQEKEKQLILENLKTTPIIQVVCQRASISRQTYYRWRAQDKQFAKMADEALFEGKSFINDLSESQLLAAIKDGNLTAVFYWLNHNHPSYANKLELDANLKLDTEKLTPQQEALVTRALKLVGVLSAGEEKGGKNNGA